jgi:hypothetical protein
MLEQNANLMQVGDVVPYSFSLYNLATNLVDVIVYDMLRKKSSVNNENKKYK